jgi:hypothetical protein
VQAMAIFLVRLSRLLLRGAINDNESEQPDVRHQPANQLAVIMAWRHQTLPNRITLPLQEFNMPDRRIRWVARPVIKFHSAPILAHQVNVVRLTANEEIQLQYEQFQPLFVTVDL